MILDAHIHLGTDSVFDHTTTEDDLERVYAEHGVDGGIVQPALPRPYLEDTRAIHDRIHRLTQNGRRRWWGMAAIDPHFRPEDYDAEAERCVRELGFVGIKLTPIGHACSPASRDGLRVFSVCQRLGVPLMIHTGNGIPFADPMAAVTGIEAYPDVRVVLAHAGSEMHYRQAIYLARKFDNVYLEPSWVGAAGVSVMLRELGSRKLMFSSDVIAQLPVELAKYRSLIPDPADLDQVLFRTVAEVYRLAV
ncbi:MAG: amidohydrolase family protein [Planctomycetes bacterium]|nr:amidohydrolase family protein [Planctomycetota bacterium]